MSLELRLGILHWHWHRDVIGTCVGPVRLIDLLGVAVLLLGPSTAVIGFEVVAQLRLDPAWRSRRHGARAIRSSVGPEVAI